MGSGNNPQNRFHVRVTLQRVVTWSVSTGVAQEVRNFVGTVGIVLGQRQTARIRLDVA